MSQCSSAVRKPSNDHYFSSNVQENSVKEANPFRTFDYKSTPVEVKDFSKSELSAKQPFQSKYG